MDAQQVTEMYDLGELTPGITFSPAIGSGYFIGIRGSATEAIGASSVGAVSLAPNSLLSQEANPENLPPNLPEWTQYLGDGVDVNPYGMPSEFEGHVIRRNVEWLTASAESSVNFTHCKI